MSFHLTLLARALLGRNTNGRAPMRQVANRTLPKNEVGFTICRTPGGQLTRGPLATGTPRAVSIPIACPSGATFEGLFHTHPGGAVTPSRIDLDSAKKFDAKVLCITNDSQTQCFRITGRR